MVPSIGSAESTLDGGSPARATHPVLVNLDFARAPNGSSTTAEELGASGPAGVSVSIAEGELTVVAPTAGAIPLSLSWIQRRTNPIRECRATGQVTLQLLAAKPATVSFKRYFSSGAGGWTGAFTGTFVRGREGDASPLRVIVRASRLGTLVPPRSGRALMDSRVGMGAPASGLVNADLLDATGVRRQSAAIVLKLTGNAGRYRLDAGARLPTQLVTRLRKKFAFTVDVFQSGRRIGGMSSGVSCRERRSGGFIKGFICSASGFHKQP